MLLDRFDIAILSELQRNGRISNRDLAERVGLSPAPCWRRLRTLEEQQIISRYAALLDAEKVGLSIIAFAHISLENHHANTVVEFDKAIQSAGEVLECYMTSGEYDYMLKVVAADMAAYEKFFSEVLMQIAAIRNVSTSFALRHKKLTTALPLKND
jgi:DNA-binding Lrp family transcriptional regulator